MFSATAFVALGLVCSVFAFTRHPIWGLYFYLATTFVYPPDRWWGYMLPDLRWALLSAGITTLAVIFHRGKLAWKPAWLGNAPAALLLAYAALMWLQTPWALDMSDHLKGSTEFVKCLIAFWLVYRVVDTKEHVRDLALALVLGCTLLGIYAQMTGRTNGRLDGVGGPNLNDSNTLGMYLACATVVAIGLILTQAGWRRYVSLVSMVLCANGFVLANSRGALIGLAAGMVTLMFCKARKHRRLFWAFAVVGGVGLVLITDRVFIERMFTIQDVTSESEDADPSARSRLAIAKAQLQMFLDHPMGTGYRGTAALSASYLDPKWLALNEETPDRSSHNTYLSALVEQGILGALLYAALLLWVALAMLRIRGRARHEDDPELATLGAALVGGLMVVLAAGMSADALIQEVQFWLYGALVSVLRMREVVQPAGWRSDGIHDMRPMAP